MIFGAPHCCISFQCCNSFSVNCPPATWHGHVKRTQSWSKWSHKWSQMVTRMVTQMVAQMVANGHKWLRECRRTRSYGHGRLACSPSAPPRPAPPPAAPQADAVPRALSRCVVPGRGRGPPNKPGGLAPAQKPLSGESAAPQRGVNTVISRPPIYGLASCLKVS